MYQVFCDNKLICDSTRDDLVLMNQVIKLKDNTVGTYEFICLTNHPNYNDLIRMKSEIRYVQDGVELFNGRIIDEHDDFRNNKKITCESELGYFNDTIQRPARYTGLSVAQYLGKLIEIHNSQVTEAKKQFQLGMVTVIDNNDSVYKYTNWNTTLDAFKSLLDTYGGHFRIRKENGIKKVDYLLDYPNVNTQSIEFGENLLDFARGIDASDIATAVIPLGAKLETSSVEGLDERLTIKDVNNGVDFVTSTGFAENQIFKTVKFDDVHVPENLKRKGEEYLSDVQFENVTLTVNAIDLNMTDSQFESFKMLDEIRVVSPRNGLDKRFPVSEMTIFPDHRSDNILTLGKSVKTGITGSQSNTNKEVMDKIENIPKPNVDVDGILQEAERNASELIHNATHGHVVTTANEQLIMDTDDINTAQRLWRWNLNGLGYSQNGYNGDYGLAITMDGQILGDRLVAGSVTAGKIDVGYKESVEKKITDVSLETDEKLTEYWTSAETESHITNESDRIKTEVSEKTYTRKQSDEMVSQQITEFEQNPESFKMRFGNIETTLNGHEESITTQEKYIHFDQGDIIVGEENNKFRTRVTNEQFNVEVDNQITSYFDQEGTHSRNLEVDNQVKHFNQWATRKGAKKSKGNNLNVVWIG